MDKQCLNGLLVRSRAKFTLRKRF